jgi:hypothetical protein
MRELRTDIEIAASSDEIGAVLTDLAAYSRWNPFIRRVYGVAEDGSALEVHRYLRPRPAAEHSGQGCWWPTRRTSCAGAVIC